MNYFYFLKLELFINIIKNKKLKNTNIKKYKSKK